MCHALERRTNDPDSASVAETVQHFITAMDSLRINLVAVDQVRCMSWLNSAFLWLVAPES